MGTLSTQLPILDVMFSSASLKGGETQHRVPEWLLLYFPQMTLLCLWGTGGSRPVSSHPQVEGSGRTRDFYREALNLTTCRMVHLLTLWTQVLALPWLAVWGGGDLVLFPGTGPPTIWPAAIVTLIYMCEIFMFDVLWNCFSNTKYIQLNWVNSVLWNLIFFYQDIHKIFAAYVEVGGKMGTVSQRTHVIEHMLFEQWCTTDSGHHRMRHGKSYSFLRAARVDREQVNTFSLLINSLQGSPEWT